MSKKSDKKRVDLDVRPEGPWYNNYDYGGPEDASESGPGRGLYNGKMDKYKTVKEFIDKKRKNRDKVRRKSALDIFNVLMARADVSMEVDSGLVDQIRQQFGPLVTNDAAQVLNTKQVSSIPIRLVYEGNRVTFQVQSTGADSAEVDASLGALLNKKYSMKMGQIISAALKGKPSAFNFGLVTVE